MSQNFATQSVLRDVEVIGDLRFRALLSNEDWNSLPPAVRKRFSKRLAGGKSVVYTGRVTQTTFNRAGYLLAQIARLIGAPLPTSRDIDVPAVVTVTEGMKHGGQMWTRLYTRRGGFPQVIQSEKRFAGPTGLEEHIGFGIGMTLTTSVNNGSLQFHSANYFMQIGRWRLLLPNWLCPGMLTVTHSEIDPARFVFTLHIEHPRFGTLIHQQAEFSETVT